MAFDYGELWRQVLRIAIVTTSYPSEEGDPAGHFVRTEARALARDAEVVVITARAHDARAEPARAAKPGEPRVVALEGGNAFGWPGVAARVTERPWRATGAGAWTWRARRAVASLGPFDRVVAHWLLPCAVPCLLPAPLFRRTARAELTVVSHGGDVRALSALPRAVRSRLVRLVVASAREWRFVSQALLGDLCAALSAAEARAVEAIARVEPCSIDMPDVRAAVARRKAEFEGVHLYVCVGRLVASKGVDRVIDHVAAGSARGARRLVIVGDGPERDALEQHARRRGVDARFVGKTSRDEALAWIGAADALIHASRVEGFSTVLREAAALGVRVVALTAWSILLAWTQLGCEKAAARPAPPVVAPVDLVAPAASESAQVRSPLPVPDAPPVDAIPVRPQLHGHGFPDHVLALTWDDGPDEHTLELARYLHHEKIAGTFFVVSAWVSGVSSDPGAGPHVFDSGYAYLPILGDLVRLGHRVGNHTKNHVLLDRVPARTVIQQLTDNQRAIDPFVTDGVRLFRAPGGAWGSTASAAVDGDPYLRQLVGPVAWDFDERDWDGSLSCTSQDPKTECEPAAPEHHPRVKPAVMAARYLAAIESGGHGIVLLHGRVGDVGSGYALAVAQVLVPALEARGYVFAAPVLAFSPPLPYPLAALKGACASTSTPLRGDLNGDGRDDSCENTGEGVTCKLGMASGGFTAASVWQAADGQTDDERSSPHCLVDVSGDARADLCVSSGGKASCALAP